MILQNTLAKLLESKSDTTMFPTRQRTKQMFLGLGMQVNNGSLMVYMYTSLLIKYILHC